MVDNVKILIVVHNNRKEIMDCLGSIERAGYSSLVLIVDNASTDSSCEKIKEKYKDIKIIKNQQNLGYAGGNNIGIKYLLKTGAKYFFILNPDTEIEKNTLGILRASMEKDNNIAIAGPKILNKNGRIWSCGGEIDKKRYSGGLTGLGEIDRGQYDDKSEVDYIPGTAMLVRKEVWNNIGLFPEKYFLYYEDTELSIKAIKNGWKIVFVPESKIIHKESSAVGKKSRQHTYYMARSHLLFVEQNAPFFVKLREILRLPITLLEHIYNKDYYAILGILDYLLRRFDKRDYWS